MYSPPMWNDGGETNVECMHLRLFLSISFAVVGGLDHPECPEHFSCDNRYCLPYAD